MFEGDHNIEKEVHVTAGQVQDEMHVTDLATAQKEDPVLNAMMNWLEEDQSEDTPGRTCFQQRGSNGVEESSEFHDSPESPLSMLYAQRGE